MTAAPAVALILAPSVGVRHGVQAAMMLGLSFKPRQVRFHLSRPVLNPLHKVLQPRPTGMAQHHRLYRLHRVRCRVCEQLRPTAHVPDQRQRAQLGRGADGLVVGLRCNHLVYLLQLSCVERNQPGVTMRCGCSRCASAVLH